MHLESVHHIGSGENVNFLFPPLPRRKKQISIPEESSIPETILCPDPISIPVPISNPGPISVLETTLIATEPSTPPASQPIKLEENSTTPPFPDLNIGDSRLKKKRGRKPKQAGSEKQEKKQKRSKAKKAKHEPDISNYWFCDALITFQISRNA